MELKAAPGAEPLRRYSRTAMILHWIIAVLILANIILVYIVDHLPDDYVRPVIDTHKSIGITVLGLAILRLLWRYAHRPPPLPASYRPWERISASAVHIVLYVLIFAIPISGWMHDSAFKDAALYPMRLFGLVSWPRISLIANVEPQTKEFLHNLFGAAHRWLGYGLFGLFALHVIGAMKHQFWDREPELQRMVPWGALTTKETK
ncbi:cytochrome b [Methylocapsa sp. S129]|uniref:cytochrome b n=1 Tax=Methylocapsa sp. S129 TaxID=1641869 RepID=UPI00131B1CD5|nr:cytochrome b [Methylocapsa sp. S129]